MRRITSLRIWKNTTDEDMTWIHTRDLRLMRRVVGAAERWWKNESLVKNPAAVAALGDAVDNFNHPPRKKK